MNPVIQAVLFLTIPSDIELLPMINSQSAIFAKYDAPFEGLVSPDQGRRERRSSRMVQDHWNES